MPVPSPVLSRAAMIRGSQGDPFLGALIPAIGALARFIPKIARPIGRAVGRVFGRGGTTPAAAATATRAASGAIAVIAPQSRAAVVARIASGLLPAAGAGIVAGAVGAGLQEVLTPEGLVVMRGRRRRMNPLNPKALRRATRRLSSFNKMAKKTQSELAKLAPPRSRRPRREHHHRDDHHHHD